jgi:hypothetical protein
MIYIVAIAIVAFSCGAAAAPSLLFRWYVAEARRLKVEPLPEEQTVAYPFV